MKVELYAIACALVAICLFKVESYFNERYSGVHYYEEKAKEISYQLEQDKISLAKLEQKQLMYQQNLAGYLPELQKENSYVARNIASTISKDSLELKKDFTQDFEKAKKYFVEGNFQSAVDILKIIEPEVNGLVIAPEVDYLLMESYHQLKNKKKVFEYIENMLHLYPEAHLSGYALIRLGDYYIDEGENRKAADCFQLAVENFSFDEQIVLTARAKLGNL